MSTNSNVFSQGGGGYAYEYDVQTAFFVSFTIGIEIPGMIGMKIYEFKQQSGSLGYQTDDLLLLCKDQNSNTRKALFQIKHNLIISEHSELFYEVMSKFWQDFSNDELFNKSEDKFYLVKKIFSKNERIHFKQIVGWAKVKATFEDFKIEIDRITAKKNYLDLVFDALGKAKGATVTDDELFQFLKCFEILEYDFGDSSSLIKNNFIALIKWSKSTQTQLTEEDIWNKILALITSSNSQGGYFQYQDIPKEIKEIFSSDHYSIAERHIEKLTEQSNEIVDLIEDSINSYHFNRSQYYEEAITGLEDNSLLLITGDAGVGKSAVCKRLIKSMQSSSSCSLLAFKSDLLHEDLNKIIKLPNYSSTATDFFTYYPLSTTNLIYIDSIEKLLEGEGLAFRQLIKLAGKSNNFKIIASCRSQSLSLILMKYFSQSKYKEIKVNEFTEGELNEFTSKIPALKTVSSNSRIRSLLKIPKYLDFAFKVISVDSSDYSSINKRDFINRLWEVIIENKYNEYKDGFPKRRADVFVDIAVNRAISMMPFIECKISDNQALEKLEKEKVIVSNSSKILFAPAHDILEDWALVRFLDTKFTISKDKNEFFETIGTSYAIRRAFRLWASDILEYGDKRKIDFIIELLNTADIQSFWKDESIIALLLSDSCELVFNQNIDQLIANNCSLLLRCINLLRTACKQPNNDGSNRYFVPIGKGWKVFYQIIANNLLKIPTEQYTLLHHVIFDYKILVDRDIVNKEELENIGKISLFLYSHFFERSNASRERTVDEELKLIFTFCGGIEREAKAFIEKVNNYNENDDLRSWKEHNYYDAIINAMLSENIPKQIAIYFPDYIFQIASRKWILDKEKLAERMAKDPWQIRGRTDIDEYFGLNSNFRNFPASAYKTPVFWLLKYHTNKTLEFVVNLINYCSTEYNASEFSKNDNCVEVEVCLNNNTTIRQIGSYVLWCMYRGTGKATPYLLQSILMALEKFLFKLAENIDERENLRECVSFLYANSRSVAITSIISSIAQAYPEILGELVVPLFSVKEFFQWDSRRYLEENGVFSITGLIDDPYLREEREEADSRPHRRKYYAGLRGFIIDYCFNIRKYNEQVFKLIDDHRCKANAGDFLWLKTLDEIDVRTWKMDDAPIIHEGKNAVVIKPTYSDAIVDELEKTSKEGERINLEDDYKALLLKAYENKENLFINKWRDIYKYYDALDSESYNLIQHYPGLLVCIGIRDFWTELTDEEKEFCFDTITDLIINFLDEAHNSEFLNFRVNPFDTHAILETFPFIFRTKYYLEYKDKLEKLLLELLIVPFPSNDLGFKLFIKSYKENLWATNSDIAVKYWYALLSFAEFDKANQFFFDHHYTEDEQLERFNKRHNFLEELIRANDLTLDLSSVSFESHSQNLVERALNFIPTINTDLRLIVLVENILSRYVFYEAKREDERRTSFIDLQFLLQRIVPDIIFGNAGSEEVGLLEFLLDLFYSQEVIVSVFENRNTELYSFFRIIIKNIIHLTDVGLNGGQRELVITNFWILWNRLDAMVESRPAQIFADIILLNIEWQENASNWLPLTGRKPFFEKAIKKYGISNTKAVVHLLATIGDTTLLPEGISWLVDLLKNKNELSVFYPYYPFAEKLVWRSYNNHIQEIRSNMTLLQDLTLLLECMVNNGSSDAYWIREYVIAHNSTNILIV